MAMEGWVDPKSHYVAHGDVQNGRMTGASVTDNNGLHLSDNMTFNSQNDFYEWARQRAGITW